MKKFIKSKIIEYAIPVMSFLIVVLALRPYCYSIRGYHAIGGEYILAGLIAYGISAVMHNSQCTIHNEKDKSLSQTCGLPAPFRQGSL